MPPPQAAPRPPAAPAPPRAPAPPSAPPPPGDHDAKRARTDFVLQAEDEFLDAHPGHSKVSQHLLLVVLRCCSVRQSLGVLEALLGLLKIKMVFKITTPTCLLQNLMGCQ